MDEMGTTTERGEYGTFEEQRAAPSRDVRAERALGSASILSAAGGCGAAVLAIVGLAGGNPPTLLAIACIVAGATVLLAGGMEGVQLRALPGRERARLGGGIGLETIGGGGAVVLGILALLGIVPVVLDSVSAIALGGALLFSSIVPAKERELASANPVAVRTGEGAAAVQGLVGLGAVALGVIALVGLATTTLDLVALLAVGGSLMITGATLFAGASLAETHAYSRMEAQHLHS